MKATNKNTDNKRTAIIYEEESIYSRGYGIIPQATMFDVTLPISSKALYAYFCSFTGAGHYIFPSRETIMNDLKISKTTFYKALNPLIEKGYIIISKAKGFINKNVYVISQSPTNVVLTKESNADESTLSYEGVNANGFGMVPKIAMCDDNLTLTAKTLLALFYSLASSGNCVFPKRSIILNSLNITKDTYYKALNLVVQQGYVIIKSRRSKNGRFNINNYILAEKPIPCPKKWDNENKPINTASSPCPKKWDNEDDRVLKNRTLPCPKKWDNNNNIFNNNSTITTSNHISSTSNNTNKELIRQEIHRLTEYEFFKSKIPEFEADSRSSIKQLAVSCKLKLKIIDVVVEMCTNTKGFKFNDATVTSAQAFDALQGCNTNNSLTYLIDEIQDHYAILKQKYIIRNPSEYLKPVIWQHITNFAYETDWWCE